MITRTQLLDALTHEDFFMRSRVLDRFGSDSDPDPAVTKQFVFAVERYGWSDAYEWPHHLTELTHDQETFAWLVRQILDDSASGPGELMRRHLLTSFAEAPVAWIAPELDRVSSSPLTLDCLETAPLQGFSPLEMAKFRVDLAEKSREDCLALYEDLLVGCGDMDAFPSAPVKYLEYVVERLAGFGVVNPAYVVDWLAVDFDTVPRRAHWRGGNAIYFAGLLKLEEAVPRLLEMFDYDWDWLNDEIPRGLCLMGTESVLDAVIEFYPEGEWHHRLYLTNVLLKLRFPGREKAIMVLLDDEEDDGLRREFAVALAFYATPEGIDAARAVYDEDPSDAERFHIAETLYPLMILRGDADPILEEWRDQMENQMESMRMGSEVAAQGGRNVPPGMVTHGSNGNSGRHRAPKQDKPGRNDPCPCGSGKMFKNCCLE